MGVETRELPSHVLEVLLDRIRKRMRAAQDPPRRRGEILVNTDGFDQVVGRAGQRAEAIQRPREPAAV